LRMEKDRIEMSQRERDVLKVMSGVLKGERPQVEAARLLKRSERQIRRLARRMKAEGDQAVVHRLRGKPSNHRLAAAVREQVLEFYKSRYADFGPTLASEKLSEEHGVTVAKETLRQLLLREGLWQRKRDRDKHRSRRERRQCFGEMVQADASEHDWLEGRGPRMVLLGMIDDATNQILVRFYPSETTEAYMDLLGRYLRKYGRPVSWYSDRDSVFRAESAKDREESVPTQFSRALVELGMELILAGSPQAKGRIERLWGTLQDRWVKELRLAGVSTMEHANRLVDEKLTREFNRRFKVKPASGNDAHRPLGPGQDLEAILSIQEARTVANDYTIRLANEFYQLLPPVWPGERGGKVIVERRLNGLMKLRFKGRYLDYRKIQKSKEQGGDMGALPPNPRSLAPVPIPAGGVPGREQSVDRADGSARPPAVYRTAGRSGRTPALPCPPGGAGSGSRKGAYRPAPTHPWRNGR
jgi:transposase